MCVSLKDTVTKTTCSVLRVKHGVANGSVNMNYAFLWYIKAHDVNIISREKKINARKMDRGPLKGNSTDFPKLLHNSIAEM